MSLERRSISMLEEDDHDENVFLSDLLARSSRTGPKPRLVPCVHGRNRLPGKKTNPQKQNFKNENNKKRTAVMMGGEGGFKDRICVIRNGAPEAKAAKAEETEVLDYQTQDKTPIHLPSFSRLKKLSVTRMGEYSEVRKRSAEQATARMNYRDSILYSRSRNIALQLARRSIAGSTYLHLNNTAPFTPPLPTFADTSSWLQLSNPTLAGCRKVAFDFDRDEKTQARLGTLLACAFHDGWIRIYEMDTIYAKEVKLRGTSNTIINIEPCLSFRTLPALDLQWNPYNRDQLVIQTNQSLQLYDLEEVSAWLHDSSNEADFNAWSNRKGPPCRCFASKCRCSTSAVIVFVPDKEHVLTAVDDLVHCFKLSHGDGGRKTVWSLQWQRVTAMTCLENGDDKNKGLVLLGSSSGDFCLIDARRLHRQAFSVGARPTVLQEWSSCHGIDHSRIWMGISHVRLESLLCIGSTYWIHVSWATAGGWIMSANMFVPSESVTESRARVLHATDPVRFVNDQFEELKTKRIAWSTPSSGQCQSHGTGQILAVEHVKPITQVLRRTDQRVLTAALRSAEETKDHQLVLMWAHENAPRHQGCVTFFRDKPLSFSIHPQHGWIAVASNAYGVYLMHTRKVASPL